MTAEPSLLNTRAQLEGAWSGVTTHNAADYEDHDPAWGQCYVTAVYVRSVHGGDVMRGFVYAPGLRPVRHYWNRINGVDVDLTWRQFPVGARLSEVEKVNPKTLLRDSSSRDRYNCLLLIISEVAM